MDRRAALGVIVSTAAAVLGTTAAPAVKRGRVTVCLSRMRPGYAWDSIPESMEAGLTSLLLRKDVVGLDLEGRVDVKFFDRDMRPWLGRDVDVVIAIDSLVKSRFWRDGKKLMSETLGGEIPGLEHLERGRMPIFRRAVDLRLSRHLSELVGPVDKSKLDDKGWGDPGDYLKNRQETWALARTEALAALDHYQAFIPVVMNGSWA